ncbi:MAG TPA: histidine kinase dimerization/phospho-acceptor domain-containing protein [Candidatus Dormibacteraeota bacterium]
MPRRLIHEPHLLAHELRTPLSVLAGWMSLARDGDIHPERTPAKWARAMQACDEAAARLNLIIKEACQEGLDQPQLDPVRVERFNSLIESTTAALEQSQRVLISVRRRWGEPQPPH